MRGARSRAHATLFTCALGHPRILELAGLRAHRMAVNGMPVSWRMPTCSINRCSRRGGEFADALHRRIAEEQAITCVRHCVSEGLESPAREARAGEAGKHAQRSRRTESPPAHDSVILRRPSPGGRARADDEPAEDRDPPKTKRPAVTRLRLPGPPTSRRSRAAASREDEAPACAGGQVSEGLESPPREARAGEAGENAKRSRGVEAGSAQEPTPNTQLVVPLPPMLSMPTRRAPSTW
jgi:hypothetical protein